MSYWDEHEKKQGSCDFIELDRQIQQITKAGGVITLCLGARQPRWPENHWPEWAWKANKPVRSAALLRYVEIVVNRYKTEPAIVSYQLENEALLKNFGQRAEIDRARLRAEYQLVKRLDPSRPVVMTTSTSWGVPVRRPIPDIVGFSFYQVLYNNGTYTTAFHSPLLDKLRAVLIRVRANKPSFIHELQCEPWGPTAIWKMSAAEQAKSMSSEQISRNIRLAQQTSLYPIDIWGAEWWYWRWRQGDTTIWETVQRCLEPSHTSPT